MRCARLLAALAASSLAIACTTAVSDQRVEGWPELAVHEHYMSDSDMRARCMRHTSVGMTPMACAEIDLGAGRCDIWYGRSSPPASLVEHERRHCRGYDHVGERRMEEMLRRHRAELSARR